jgi:hypothetical protein
MNDNCTFPPHLCAGAAATVGGGLSPVRQSTPARRGRALFVEALSLSFAREDHRSAAVRLRALADRDAQVLDLALGHCRELLRDTPDDPGVSDAVGLLARAMRPIEGAA